MAESLPCEVLCTIFEYLSCSKKCEVELVCRKWRSVSRSCQAIWRDGLFCEGVGVPESALSSRKLNGMLLRSGGVLHTAAFRISGSTILDANASRSMLQILPSTKLKNLWIDCGTRWRYTDMTDRSHQFPISFSNALRRATNSAVLKCSGIKCLRLSTPNGTESLKVVRGSPLASCTLDLLWLWSDGFDDFFSDGSGFEIAGTLRCLQIRRAAPGWYPAGLPFLTGWKLLQKCSTTLESAELELKSFSSIDADSCSLDMYSKLSAMNKRISLPRLKYLRLISYDNSARTAETGLHYFFNTPCLNTLYIEGSVPVESILSILESSTDTLKTLLISRSGFKFSDDRQMIKHFCRALCKCHLLEDLTLMVDSPMLLLQILSCLQQMRLRTLSIYLDNDESGAGICVFAMITKQSTQGYSYTSGRLVLTDRGHVDNRIMSAFALLSSSLEIVQLPSTTTLSSRIGRLRVLGNYSLLSLRDNESCKRF